MTQQEPNNWQRQVWQQPASAQQPVQQTPSTAPDGYRPGGQPPYYAPYPPQPQKKNHGWIIALVVIVLVFVLALVGVTSCTSALSSSFSSLGTTGSSSNVDFLAEDAVGVISIDGTIQYDGTTSSPEGLKEQLDRAQDDSHIKAVVLRVDSGGGTATAGEEMASYVRGFIEASGKPVVVSSASTNASAAYEISSQADYIFTAKTTAIGAIGTALQITDLSGLLDKLGISIDNVTSSNSKDSSYGTRPLTEEERVYYQNMVNQINETFIENVAEGRGMPVDEVRTLATGLTFTGVDAVENGLADEIGTKEDAVAKAAELAGTSQYQTVQLQQSGPEGLTALLDLLAQNNVSTDDVVAAIEELGNDDSVAR